MATAADFIAQARLVMSTDVAAGSEAKLQTLQRGIEGVAVAAEKQERAQRSGASSLDRLIQKYDPLARATAQYERELRQIERALERDVTLSDKAARAKELVTQRLQEQSRAFGQSAQGVDLFGGALGKVNGLLGAFGVALGAGAILQFGRELFTMTAQLADTSDQLGISTDAIQAYRIAFQGAGVDAAATDAALSRFVRRIGEARSGSADAAEAFARQGVSLRALDGSWRSVTDVLDLAAQASLRFGDATERNQFLVDVFGRGGDKLAAGLGALARGTDTLIAKTREYGGIIDADIIRRADAFDDAWAAGWATFKANAVTVISEVGDLLQGIVTLGGTLSLGDGGVRVGRGRAAAAAPVTVTGRGGNPAIAAQQRAAGGFITGPAAPLTTDFQWSQDPALAGGFGDRTAERQREIAATRETRAEAEREAQARERARTQFEAQLADMERQARYAKMTREEVQREELIRRALAPLAARATEADRARAAAAADAALAAQREAETSAKAEGEAKRRADEELQRAEQMAREDQRIWRDALSGKANLWDSYLERLKSQWLDALAQMASQIISPIIRPIFAMGGMGGLGGGLGGGLPGGGGFGGIDFSGMWSGLKGGFAPVNFGGLGSFGQWLGLTQPTIGPGGTVGLGNTTFGNTFGGALSGAGMGYSIGSLATSLGYGKNSTNTQIGGAIGGAIGTAVGGPIGGLIGSTLGTAVGGMLGPRPTNAAASLGFDPTTGTAFGGWQSSKGNSAENLAALQGMAAGIAPIFQSLRALGVQFTEVLNGVNFGVRDRSQLFLSGARGGMRDGRRVDLSTVGDPADVASAIVRELTRTATADDPVLRGILGRGLGLEQLNEALGIYQLVKDADMAGSALTRARTAVLDVAKAFDTAIGKAREYGISAELLERRRGQTIDRALAEATGGLIGTTLGGTYQQASQRASLFGGLRTGLQGALDQLATSNLAPVDPLTRYTAARSLFEATAQRAGTGDLAAISRLAQQSQSFLTMSADFNATGTLGYARDFRLVQDALRQAEAFTGREADSATAIVSAVDKSNELLTKLADGQIAAASALTAIAEELRAAARAQIGVLGAKLDEVAGLIAQLNAQTATTTLQRVA